MTRFFPDISLTVNNIPDMFQIPLHFQVFQTSGHPVDLVMWYLYLSFEIEFQHDQKRSGGASANCI